VALKYQPPTPRPTLVKIAIGHAARRDQLAIPKPSRWPEPRATSTPDQRANDTVLIMAPPKEDVTDHEQDRRHAIDDHHPASIS
jgi:hypothetical protein